MKSNLSSETPIFSLQYPSPKIIFLYGFPGCEKKYQASRLSTEFGYVHLDMKTLMAQEIKRGTGDGLSIQKTLEAGVVPSSKIRVSLLIRSFVLNPAPSYVITGFLKNLSEALEFEKEVCGIKIIVNFCISNWDDYFTKKPDNPKLAKIEEFRAVQQEVIEFYKHLNIVRDLDVFEVPDRVFRRLKKIIQPEVFFIIGVPGCGKTTLAKRMSEKYNLYYLDIANILWEKTIGNQVKKITDDSSITKKLVIAMEQVSSMRFLVEGFPMNLYQLKQFEVAFGMPKKLFYLGLYKEELILRCKRPQISIEYLEYLKKSGEMLDYAGSKPYFSRINVNLSIEESFLQIANEIEPEVVMVLSDTENYIKNFLINKGYQYINLHEAMKSVCSRKTEKGKEIIKLTESGKIVSGRLLIQIIQELIYSGSTFGKKFVLTGSYPGKIKEMEYIEKNCVKIQRVYYYAGADRKNIVSYVEEEVLETYLFNQGRLVVFNATSDPDLEFKIELEQRIDRAFGRYILFLGPMLSGKSTLAKKLSDKYGFKLVVYEELPDIIKTKKSTEDEPYEKVVFQDILEEIKSYMEDPKQTIVLNGIPPENLVLPEIEVVADDEEVQDRTEEYIKEVHQKFLEVLGIPYLVLNLSTDIKYLKPRLFKKLELGPEDELNEDQLEPLLKSIKFNADLSSKFIPLNKTYPIDNLKASKKKIYYEVNTNVSEDRSFSFTIAIISTKLILVEETAQKNISTLLNNICINKDLVHLNVPKLLKAESVKNNERGMIISSLLKQKLSVPANLIISVLKDQLKNLLVGDQIVVLSQFLDNKDPYQYPRTMDEFVAIEENLGEIVGVIVVTPRMKKRQIEIDNIPVIHYPPPKKEEEPPKAEEEEEERLQKPPEEVLPPRSDPRKPVNLPKMFQIYKRNFPKFVNLEEEDSLQDAITEVFKYVALEKYLSNDDQERLRCPNIQILN
jgi:adenylate kinase family enzyme